MTATITTPAGTFVTAAPLFADERPRPAKWWTIAWRKRTANHFRRANNWAGTWAEAVEMAGAFAELHPEMQVYYTVTAEYETWQAADLARRVSVGEITEEFAGDYLADHANILNDDGRKRIKIRETGVLDDELIDDEINRVAGEAHETTYVRGADGITTRRALDQWFASPLACRAWARDIRACHPKDFAVLLAASRTADERYETKAI